MVTPKLAMRFRLIARSSVICLLAALVPTGAYAQDFAHFFGPELTRTLPAGLTSLTTLNSHLEHPSLVPVTSVSWPAASMNPAAPAALPTAPSLSTHREKTTTMRVIGVLLGAGVAGLGAYLVSTSDDGSGRVAICTLCSDPPVSQTHVSLTGKQGVGIASIAAGAGLVIWAAIP